MAYKTLVLSITNYGNDYVPISFDLPKILNDFQPKDKPWLTSEHIIIPPKNGVYATIDHIVENKPEQVLIVVDKSFKQFNLGDLMYFSDLAKKFPGVDFEIVFMGKDRQVNCIFNIKDPELFN